MPAPPRSVAVVRMSERPHSSPPIGRRHAGIHGPRRQPRRDGRRRGRRPLYRSRPKRVASGAPWPSPIGQVKTVLRHLWITHGGSAHDGDECGLMHAARLTADVVRDIVQAFGTVPPWLELLCCLPRSSLRPSTSATLVGTGTAKDAAGFYERPPRRPPQRVMSASRRRTPRFTQSGRARRES